MFHFNSTSRALRIPQQRLEIEFSQLALEQNRNPACIAPANDHTLSDHFQVTPHINDCATRCLTTVLTIICRFCGLEHVVCALKLMPCCGVESKIDKFRFFGRLFQGVLMHSRSRPTYFCVLLVVFDTDGPTAMVCSRHGRAKTVPVV